MACFVKDLKWLVLGTSLVAQWLRICTPNAGVLVWIPVWETRSYMLQQGPSTVKYINIPLWSSGHKTASASRSMGSVPDWGRSPVLCGVAKKVNK